MIRKVAMGTMAAAAIGGLVFGKDMISYVRTGCTAARERIRSEVPIEFEIERARQEVDRLIPEMRKSMHRMAQEQVEVQQLRAAIDKREKSLARQEEAILSLSADLKSNDARFVYAGHSYSQHEVQKDLAERFNRFKIADETLKRERQLLSTKEHALAANRETLEGMLSQKKDLEVELQRLEARLRTVDARKQMHGLEVDDSQLNRAKTLITTIEKRLDVEDALLAAEGDLHGLIPVEQEEEPELDQIAETIDEYFHSRPRQESIPEIALER